MVESVSPAQARRITLAAQGFGRPRRDVGTRQLNLLLQRLAVLQLDSVNVFSRSHYLPALARLGPYDRALLDRLTFSGRGPYTEYWAHQAALIPLADRPLWGWAMERWRTPATDYGRWGAAHPEMLEFLRAELADKGPLTAREVEHDANQRRGPWWGWSEVKTGLETLFMWGEVVAAGRNGFERVYDLAERRIPSELIETKVAKPDAVRELVRRAARALGIATRADLADYFRLRSDDTAAAIAALVDEGELVPVTVPGWKAKAWLHRDARIPRRIEAAALLSPFDPVVWDRARALRMFGLHYRIEIYTPAPKRVYGYYTLPVLLDDAIVGRIDLKTDRQAGVLRVQSAWREADAFVDAGRVAGLVREAAAWQGLERVEVADWGDLTADLRSALG